MPKLKFKLGSKGFTLYEAMVATVVLTIGLVGLLSVMRRGLIGDVEAWDKLTKTNIGLTRIEEHKAELYQQLVPGLQMPVVAPVITYGATPVINFRATTITYSSTNMVSINCATNAITAQSGYGVVLATPTLSPSYYWGSVVASPTPTMEWIDVNNRTACDQTNGDIHFKITTPPNVNGTLALWFVDGMGLSRQQSVWMNGLQRGSYGPGNISSNFASPTTLSFAVNNYDTAGSALDLEVRQAGTANDWGSFMEDGSANDSGMTIYGGANTPTSTPTPATCVLNVCNQLGPSSLTLNGGFGTNPSNTYVKLNNNSGYCRTTFTANCTGYYQVYSNIQSGRLNNGGNCNTELTAVMSGSSVSLCGAGAAVTATWWMDPSDCGSSGPQTARMGGANFAGSQPATWFIGATGSYTLNIYSTANISNGYPHIFWICINQIATAATPTFTPVNTYTPTATPASAFTFPAHPTPLAMSPPSVQASPFISGSPSWAVNGCDPNLTALTGSGKADATGQVRWHSQYLVYTTADGPVTGVTLDGAGNVYANVRMMAGMSVTMSVITNAATPVTYTVNSGGGAAAAGWYQLVTGSIPAGVTLVYLNFDFSGASSAVTNYLAVDSVRVVYPSPLNPNSVLLGSSLSILNKYVDYVNFAPYVVESYVLPMTVSGNANGYQIASIVHNGRIAAYYTPTPGATPSSPIPQVTVTDQFPPVTIINTISQ